MTESKELSKAEAKDIAVEANKHTFDDATLKNITSMDDALKALGSIGASVEEISAYGSGFEVIDNKDRLIGKTFVILEWRFTDSPKYNSRFVSALCLDEAGNKFVVNDGSTGICTQLENVTAERLGQGLANPQAGIVAKGGLRRSDYRVEDPSNPGETIEASTYYLV